eukprot:Lithocolla_globosa_v1_NODE_1774_length_2345_cov_78.798253.p1 type:complete len:347 gc:universal NODE_1774_length_2345_cov_78.798253:46-1086(+)
MMNVVLIALLLAYPTLAQQINAVIIVHSYDSVNTTMDGRPASFGQIIPDTGLTGLLVNVGTACNEGDISQKTSDQETNYIALIERGDCTFSVKIRNAGSTGFTAAIVYDNQVSAPLVTMAPDAESQATSNSAIPSVFITNKNGDFLVRQLKKEELLVTVGPVEHAGINNHWTVIVFIGILAILISSFFILVFLIIEIYRQRRLRAESMPKPVPEQIVINLPIRVVDEADVKNPDGNLTCAVCLDDFEVGEQVRELPCTHDFHVHCIDPWLLRHSRLCPTCKRDVSSLMSTVPRNQSQTVRESGLEEAIELNTIVPTTNTEQLEPEAVLGSEEAEDSPSEEEQGQRP